MLTVEIRGNDLEEVEVKMKANKELLHTITIVNADPARPDIENVYHYLLDGRAMGTVMHRRREGALALATKVLAMLNEKENR